jgi:hypothetical protein
VKGLDRCLLSPTLCAALDNTIKNRFLKKTTPILLKDQEEIREGARNYRHVMATRDISPYLYLISLPHLSVSLFPLFLLDGGIALESNTVLFIIVLFYKKIDYGYILSML